MEAVRFVCTSLVGTGKKGILVPDENGQYTQPIGGLDVIIAQASGTPPKALKRLWMILRSFADVLLVVCFVVS